MAKRIGILGVATIVIAMFAVVSTPVMASCNYAVSTGSYGTSGTLQNGTIYVDGKGASVLGHKPPVEHVEFATIPNGTVKWARVYWHVWGGTPDYWGWSNATFCNATGCWHNNRSITGMSCQQNQSMGWYKGGFGTHWLYWDVTDRVYSGEQHNISINNTIPPGTWDGRTMWVYLVVVLDDLDDYSGSEMVTHYWVNQGYEDLDEDEQSTTWFNGSATTVGNGTLWHLGLCSDITSGGIWFSGHHVRDDVPGDLTEEEIDASWIKTANNNMTWDNGNDPYFHPVMAIFMVKSKPVHAIIDTGRGTYPSIAGTHKGTSTPNRTIEVNKLYTYACTGTAGHSEYVEIYNDSFYMNATWHGNYTGDYHNISFPDQFLLLASHTYNYTIKTGSYPQIHHTNELEVADGIIICTEFIDVNGEIHNNRIPAIKLFAQKPKSLLIASPNKM